MFQIKNHFPVDENEIEFVYCVVLDYIDSYILIVINIDLVTYPKILNCFIRTVLRTKIDRNVIETIPFYFLTILYISEAISNYYPHDSCKINIHSLRLMLNI